MKNLVTAVFAYLQPAGWRLEQDCESGYASFTAPYGAVADLVSDHINEEIPWAQARLSVEYEAWDNKVRQAEFRVSDHSGKSGQARLAKELAQALVLAAQAEMKVRMEQADPFAA